MGAAVGEQKESKKAQDRNIQDKKQHLSIPTKVIIRRLPPSITETELLEQLAPLPDYDYFYFAPADLTLLPWAFSRAYFNLTTFNDVILFRDRFDGYVFLDKKGNEYPAMVELAPFQKVPVKKQKKDPKCNTYEKDPDYKAFLEELQNPKKVELPTLTATLAEIEKRDKEIKDSKGICKVKTPLIEFIEWRRDDKKSRRDERRKLKEERLRFEAEERKRRLEREKFERLKAEKERDEKKEVEKSEKAPRFAKKLEKSKNQKPVGKTEHLQPESAPIQIKQREVRKEKKDIRDDQSEKFSKTDTKSFRLVEKFTEKCKETFVDPEKKKISFEIGKNRHQPECSSSKNVVVVNQPKKQEENRVEKEKEEKPLASSLNRKEKPKRDPKPSRYKEKPSMPLYQPAQFRKKQLEETEKPLVFKDDDD